MKKSPPAWLLMPFSGWILAWWAAPPFYAWWALAFEHPALKPFSGAWFLVYARFATGVAGLFATAIWVGERVWLRMPRRPRTALLLAIGLVTNGLTIFIAYSIALELRVIDRNTTFYSSFQASDFPSLSLSAPGAFAMTLIELVPRIFRKGHRLITSRWREPEARFEY